MICSDSEPRDSRHGKVKRFLRPAVNVWAPDVREQATRFIVASKQKAGIAAGLHVWMHFERWRSGRSIPPFRFNPASTSTAFHVIREQQDVRPASLVAATQVSDLISTGQGGGASAIDLELPEPPFKRGFAGNGTGKLIELAIGRFLIALAQCK